MKTYRLDRRFVLRAVGLNVVVAAVLSAAAFVMSGVGQATSPLLGVGAVGFLGHALWLAARPPVVVRTDAHEIRIGGRLTVQPVRLEWTAVEGVESDPYRLYLDRGDGTAVALPIAYVGLRYDELIRDIYHRLNDANGYTRFRP